MLRGGSFSHEMNIYFKWILYYWYKCNFPYTAFFKAWVKDPVSDYKGQVLHVCILFNPLSSKMFYIGLKRTELWYKDRKHI